MPLEEKRRVAARQVRNTSATKCRLSPDFSLSLSPLSRHILSLLARLSPSSRVGGDPRLFLIAAGFSRRATHKQPVFIAGSRSWTRELDLRRSRVAAASPLVRGLKSVCRARASPRSHRFRQFLPRTDESRTRDGTGVRNSEYRRSNIDKYRTNAVTYLFLFKRNVSPILSSSFGRTYFYSHFGDTERDEAKALSENFLYTRRVINVALDE